MVTIYGSCCMKNFVFKFIFLANIFCFFGFNNSYAGDTQNNVPLNFMDAISTFSGFTKGFFAIADATSNFLKEDFFKPASVGFLCLLSHRLSNVTLSLLLPSSIEKPVSFAIAGNVAIYSYKNLDSLNNVLKSLYDAAIDSIQKSNFAPLKTKVSDIFGSIFKKTTTE